MAVAAAAVATVCVAGCGSVSHPDARPPKPTHTRAAAFHGCPPVHAALPDGFHLARRELSALAEQRMGKVEIYRHGRSQVQLFTGTDVYDKLDDMDLVPRRVTVDGRAFDVYSTTVDPTLLVAELDDPRLEQPCDNAGILTRHVPRAVFQSLLRSFRADLGS